MFSLKLKQLRQALENGQLPTQLPVPVRSKDLEKLLEVLAEFAATTAIQQTVQNYKSSKIWSPAALRIAVFALLCHGQSEQAAVWLRLTPVTAEWRGKTIAFATELSQSGLRDHAILWLELLSQAWPDDVHPVVSLAALYMENGRYLQAEQLLAPWCTASAVRPECLLLYVAALTATLQTVRARQHLRLLIGAKFENAEYQLIYLSHCVLLGVWPLAAIALSQLPTAVRHDLRVKYLWVQINRAARNYPEALRLLQSLPLQSHHAEIHLCEAASCYAEQLMLDEAIAQYARFDEMGFNSPNAKFNQALLYFLKGDWRAGWVGFEGRNSQNFGMMMSVHNYAHLPLWDGQPTPKGVVLYTEQGLGDTVQMLRYIPQLAARVGAIQFAISDDVIPLLELLTAESGSDEVGEKQAGIDAGDMEIVYRVPLMSLPHLLEEYSPSGEGYLTFTPELEALGEELITKFSNNSRKKIGVVWAGNPNHFNDFNRSLHFSQLHPLFGLDDVDFLLLQVGSASAQIDDMTLPANVIDCSVSLTSLKNLAAFLSQLDYLISVDSMPAHLAGAFGVPTLLMVPFFPDWRWGLDKENTPLYNAMTLFRQTVRGNWRPVIEEITLFIADEYGLPMPDSMHLNQTENLPSNPQELLAALEKDPRQGVCWLRLFNLYIDSDDLNSAAWCVANLMLLDESNPHFRQACQDLFNRYSVPLALEVGHA